MADKVFFDTNILVYAFDRGDAARQKTASELLEESIRAQAAVISLQVVQEFYVVTTRKILTPLLPEAARSAVGEFLRLQVIEPNAVHVIRAINLSIAHCLSFWDALIITAAATAGCSILYSEDLAAGSSLANVRIINPFK